MQDTPLLYELTDMNKPQAVLEEIRTIYALIRPADDFGLIRDVFGDILHLFTGNYPGYRKNDTGYHDLYHTTDVMLAAARLVHGAATTGVDFNRGDINQLLVCAMTHDTGYIQRETEPFGTGARYTAIHIERSIDFVREYLKLHPAIDLDPETTAQILRCTGLNVRIQDIPFRSEKARFLGFILGTADLLGQMADRYYLEKLPILYREFREGNIPGFSSDGDLISKTPDFYTMASIRFEKELGGVNRFMANHFEARWAIPHDLYAAAIGKNMDYLKEIVEKGQDFRENFKRKCLFQDRFDGTAFAALKRKGLKE
jgi:hypothetical protein